VLGVEEDPGWHKGTIWFDNIFPFAIPFDPRSPETKAATYIAAKKYIKLIPQKFPIGRYFRLIEANLSLLTQSQI
jgi:hypothetical protein